MPDAAIVGLEAAANACLYAAVLLAVGVSTARVSVSFGPGGLPAATLEQLARGLTRVGRRVAVIVALALGLTLWAHTVSVFGWSESFSWSQVSVIALESRWGRSWWVQAAASMGLIGAYLASRARFRLSWFVPVVASVVMSCTLPLVGHAAGDVGRIALHSLHVLAAGIWLGTLAVVLLLGRSTIGPAGESTREIARALLGRFSPIALSGMSALVVTGLVSGALYVGAASNLRATLYGRVLTAKVLLFVGVGACGWLNWRRFADIQRLETADRRITSSVSADPLSLVRIEVALAAVIVALTGLLTQIEHP